MPSRMPIIQNIIFKTSDLEEFVRSSAIEIARKSEIWREDKAPTLERIQLFPLDRVGGKDGYSGSQVFVAKFYGSYKEERKELKSSSLLLKVAYGDRAASNLLEEEKNYKSIKNKLPRRHHVEVLRSNLSSNNKMCIQWSEFIQETGFSDLPESAQPTLRESLHRENWEQAQRSLTCLYDTTLKDMHVGHNVSDYAYFEAYRDYRRSGWLEDLAKAVGEQTDTFSVFGYRIRNPCILYRKLEKSSDVITGKAHLSAVHGDLHPNNVLVNDSQPAVLIDYGWSKPAFNTVVDFVLMEASLKFFSLAWNVNRSDLKQFERAVVKEFLPDQITVNDTNMAFMRNYVKLIREKASRFVDAEDFELQYLLPLFCVTMGQFKYAKKVNNLSYLLFSAGLLAEKLEEKFGL